MQNQLDVSFLESLSSSLNDKQREAVLHIQGPLMVLAGAGSGKTKMLTSRIAYLIEHCQVFPYQVLAMTFTQKAAQEMRERVAHLLGIAGGWQRSGLPEIGTFHSVCVRLLRQECLYTPFTKPFVVYDDADQLSLIKLMMKGFELDDKKVNPKVLQFSINRAKCDATEGSASEFFGWRRIPFDAIYKKYQQMLFDNNAIDFGEIICLAYRLLRDHQELREKYQSRYRYLHVDEYQDTNRSQYLFLSQLASSQHGGHENICVVGDEDQSIYSWRGADIRNILDFEKDYPGAHMVKLEQNYRSTQNILRVAGAVISKNKARRAKTLWTENSVGLPVVWMQLAEERAEAQAVVHEIQAHVKEGCRYSDCAIFYRTHAQSRQFEDILRKEKIDYQVIGGVRFYDRKEIKDILAYFKVILNPNDAVSFKRILNVPGRGIGKSTVEKLETLEQSGRFFWEVLDQVAQDSELISPAVTRKIAPFVSQVKGWIQKQPELSLCELYTLILEDIGYVRLLRQENTEESLARVQNLEELMTLLQEFEEEQDCSRGDLLSLFLEQSTLVSEVASKEDTSCVKLMTFHSSKGLEFPIVFMVGMEEGLFPSFKALESKDRDLEEEFRLCYVGMTRARQRLYLSSVLLRRIWGETSFQKASSLLEGIPLEWLEVRSDAQQAARKDVRMKKFSLY